MANIWAVGRNYADHAKELGNQPAQASGEPLVFLKAGSTAVPVGKRIRLPSWSSEIHHELELALRFGADLKFTDFTIALDLTARDIQEKLKSKSQPWTLAKSFQDSCPLGEPMPLSQIPGGYENFSGLKFSLTVNGEIRQRGNASDMIHDAEKLRQYVCSRFPVEPGDWLLTGTPAGVASIRAGDKLEAAIEGLYKAQWTVA